MKPSEVSSRKCRDLVCIVERPFSNSELSKRTSCHEGHVLYLYRQMQEPVATCGFEHLKGGQCDRETK